MISSFIESKLKNASYKILADRTYFAEIKGLRGVWANAKTLEKCREQLQEVLEDWLLVKVKSGEKISGFSFSFDKRNKFHYA